MVKDFFNNVFNKKIKLHVGCGTLYKDTWINIDNNTDNNIEKLDINHDLSKGLPFDDLAVDFIYNEHFIEHLSREDGLLFLKECFRVLKNGGVLRIACPDLDDIIKNYLNDTWRELDWVTRYNYQGIESGCQMINMCLNESPWGHKYVYSKDELKKRLIDAGFINENITETLFNKSEYEELINIDSRLDSMIFDVRK